MPSLEVDEGEEAARRSGPLDSVAASRRISIWKSKSKTALDENIETFTLFSSLGVVLIDFDGTHLSAMGLRFGRGGIFEDIGRGRDAGSLKALLPPLHYWNTSSLFSSFVEVEKSRSRLGTMCLFGSR